MISAINLIMKLKTIINTKSYLLTYSLILSVSLHLCTWLLAPSYNRSLFLNDALTAKAITVKDHFIEIIPEQKRSESKSADVASAQVAKPKKKPKKRKIKRVNKVKRVSKRRNKKKRKQPIVVKKTLQVQKPAKKPARTQLATSNAFASSKTKANQPVSENSNNNAVKTENSTSEGSETQVAQRISKSALRGILRGYYKNLNSLMSTRRDYPRSARRLGLEGTVLVEMVIDHRGQILSVKLVQSSGHQVLDQAAIAQVHKIGKVPSIPNQIKRNSMTFRIPFEYRLQS